MNFETRIGRNRRRTAVLLVFLFGLVWFTSYVAGAYLGAGGISLTMIAAAVAVGAAWGSYWKSDTIVLAVTRARVTDDIEAPQLHNVVEEVCLAAGLPKPRIAIVDDPAPNAFATGRDPQHAVVAFTTGLLERMDREELQGVAAHELAHVANRDTLVMSIAATSAGIVALIADLLWRIAFFGGGDRKRDTHPLALVAGLVGVILAPLAAALLRSSISRSRETLADASAVAYTRNPAGLRRALEKLAADSTVVRARSNATAHLWIESPLSGKASKLFATHPPIEERIAALRSLEGLDR
jgi:heat shock protein HtpX